jgi:hypothetical protein
MSNKSRKKTGVPLAEDAMSPVAVIRYSPLCRTLSEAHPGLSPYISESYLARLVYDFQVRLEVRFGFVCFLSDAVIGVMRRVSSGLEREETSQITSSCRHLFSKILMKQDHCILYWTHCCWRTPTHLEKRN